MGGDVGADRYITELQHCSKRTAVLTFLAKAAYLLYSAADDTF